MVERDILEKKYNRQYTQGERDQVDKLKKLSDNPQSIVETKEKLKELKSNLYEKKAQLENNESTEKIEDNERTFSRRYNDRFSITKKPLSLFNQVLQYFTIKQEFNQKYKNVKKVSGRFFNFIFNKPLFFPNRYALSRLQEFIQIQNDLKQVARKLYNGGWVDDFGREILNPKEFNILSEFERLIQDSTLLNFKIYKNDPPMAIKKLSSFLANYFSITRSDEVKNILFSSFRTSLIKIVFTKFEDKERVDEFYHKCEMLLSDEFEDDFIIPLFESYLMKVFNHDELREIVQLHNIEELVYMADHNLSMLMGQKKRNAQDDIIDKVESIERELALITIFVEAAKKDIPFENGVKHDRIDYIILKNYDFKEEVFELKISNIISYVADAYDLFMKLYEAFLTEETRIFNKNELKNIRLFDPEIFKVELGNVKSERKKVATYARYTFTNEILKKSVLDKNESLIMGSINLLVDNFYNIGFKIFSMLQGHEQQTAKGAADLEKTIEYKKYTESVIPFFEGRVISPQLKKEAKSVGKILNDMMNYVFCFVSKFEYENQNFDLTKRKMSLKDKINKVSIFNSELEKLTKISSG